MKKIVDWIKKRFHEHDWVCVRSVTPGELLEPCGISNSEAWTAAWNIGTPSASARVCLKCGEVHDDIEQYKNELLKKISDLRERKRHANEIYHNTKTNITESAD